MNQILNKRHVQSIHFNLTAFLVLLKGWKALFF